MRKLMLMLAVLAVALPSFAGDQATYYPSHNKARKPVRTYTNDNIPTAGAVPPVTKMPVALNGVKYLNVVAVRKGYGYAGSGMSFMLAGNDLLGLQVGDFVVAQYDHGRLVSVKLARSSKPKAHK